MKLVRQLFFIAASNNFHIIIQHIPGTDISIYMERFRSLAPEAKPHQAVIPAQAMSLRHDLCYTFKSKEFHLRPDERTDQR